MMSSEEEAPTPLQEPEQVKKTDEPPPAAAAAKEEEEEEKPAKLASGSGSPAAAEEEKPITYRALVLTGYGGCDKIKLQVKSMKKASLKAGEVLVRVKACGLNFAELLGKQGLYELLPSPPVTLGMEGSGVIEAVAEDVTDRKVSN